MTTTITVQAAGHAVNIVGKDNAGKEVSHEVLSPGASKTVYAYQGLNFFIGEVPDPVQLVTPIEAA